MNGNTKGKEILESVIKMAKWIGLAVIARALKRMNRRISCLTEAVIMHKDFIFQER